MALGYYHPNIIALTIAYILNHVTHICLCSNQPTTYAQATSTYMLGMTTINSASFSVGETYGVPEVDVAATPNVPITNPGTIKMVALVSGDEMLYTGRSDNTVVSVGGTVTIEPWHMAFNVED